MKIIWREEDNLCVNSMIRTIPAGLPRRPAGPTPPELLGQNKKIIDEVYLYCTYLPNQHQRSVLLC